MTDMVSLRRHIAGFAATSGESSPTMWLTIPPDEVWDWYSRGCRFEDLSGCRLSIRFCDGAGQRGAVDDQFLGWCDG